MKLNANEERIMIYIREHLEEIPYLSSRELAKRVYSNPTSIMRLVKKLGFVSYNDFKVNIVSTLKDHPAITKEIQSNEDVLSLVSKVAKIQTQALQQTKETLNTMILQQVLTCLKKAGSIDLYANDTNASLAQYAKHLFFLAGKLSHVYDQDDLQLQASLLSTPDQAAIFISKYAKNSHLLTAARQLKQAGVPTIALTSSADNPLAKACQFHLVVPFAFTHQKISELDFYIGAQYYLHLCYVYLYSQSYEQALQLEKDFDLLFWK